MANEDILQRLKTQWDQIYDSANPEDRVQLNRILASLKQDKMSLALIYAQKTSNPDIINQFLNMFKSEQGGITPQEPPIDKIAELETRITNLEQGNTITVDNTREAELETILELKEQVIADQINRISELEANSGNADSQIEYWKNNPEGLGIGTIFQALYTSETRNQPLFDLEDFKIVGKQNYREICKFRGILEAYCNLDNWNTWVNSIENPHPADSESYNQWENRRGAFQQCGQELGQMAQVLKLILDDYTNYHIYEN